MIKNSNQYNSTKEKVVELKSLKEGVVTDETMSEIEKIYSLNSFEGMISMLEEELSEYDSLKNGNFQILQAKSLDEFPSLLIRARIAQGMSQTLLAKTMDLKPQQIQRYEANDYQSISFYRLIEIANAIGVCVNFEKTIIVGSGPQFEIPSNVNEDSIESAENKIKSHCSLVF